MTNKHPGNLSDDLDRLIQQLAVGEPVEAATLLAAIRQQEQQPHSMRDLANLAGTWQLVWTSGTRKTQPDRAQKAMVRSQSALGSTVLQQIDVERSWFDNQVRFPLGKLTVAGPFTYSTTQRLEFTFTRLHLQLGQLPALPVPLGQWAKGWLQTTYLDEAWHIERGDRGGVSIYRRRDEPE